ncbi:hypothetical protein SRHO_G00104010 [Serrasalmus rhombeus]
MDEHSKEKTAFISPFDALDKCTKADALVDHYHIFIPKTVYKHIKLFLCSQLMERRVLPGDPELAEGAAVGGEGAEVRAGAMAAASSTGISPAKSQVIVDRRMLIA